MISEPFTRYSGYYRNQWTWKNLKGLEYLEENSLMRKAADLAKGKVETASNMI